MQYKLSDVERRVLLVLQGGMPKSTTPYRDMAAQAGVDTQQLLGILNDWKINGRMRRAGAVVNHFKVGLGAGAMVVWKVGPEQVEQVGKMLASFSEVSHAYERILAPGWPYNLYTMVHGVNEREVTVTVEKMSRACGISDYKALPTKKELKKVPPTYISKA